MASHWRSFEHIDLSVPLFQTAGEYPEVADLGWAEGFHYYSGYWQAARSLVEHAERSEYETDQLIYPVVFLYRHTIELLMKTIIGNVETPDETHDLQRLWTKCRQVIKQHATGYGGASLDEIEARIKEFAERDPGNATKFRYAYDKSGKRSVTGHVNLFAFAERADQVCEALDGWDTGVYEGLYADRGTNHEE